MYCHTFLFLLLSVFILACHQHGFPQRRFPKRCTRRSGPKRLICGRWGCPDNPPVGKHATTAISPHPRAGEVSFHRRRQLTLGICTKHGLHNAFRHFVHVRALNSLTLYLFFCGRFSQHAQGGYKHDWHTYGIFSGLCATTWHKSHAGKSH